MGAMRLSQKDLPNGDRERVPRCEKTKLHNGEWTVLSTEVQEYCHLANFKGQSSFILSLPLSLFQVSELGQEARALARSPRDG